MAARKLTVTVESTPTHWTKQALHLFSPMLIDTHAHLDDPLFERDLDDVVSPAAGAGAPDRDSPERAIARARRFPGVYAAVGCHPHEADEMKPDEVRAWLVEL